jgi:ABC-type lipoprotein release transport system permease subunit
MVLALRETALAGAGAVLLALAAGLYPALRAAHFDAVRAVRAG